MTKRIDELKQAQAVHPTHQLLPGVLAYAYSRAGHRDHALPILKELTQRSQSEGMAIAIAHAYIGMDDKDHALEWLERAYQQRSPELVRIQFGPAYDSLSSDPRYADLVRRIGFPP